MLKCFQDVNSGESWVSMIHSDEKRIRMQIIVNFWGVMLWMKGCVKIKEQLE